MTTSKYEKQINWFDEKIINRTKQLINLKFNSSKTKYATIYIKYSISAKVNSNL